MHKREAVLSHTHSVSLGPIPILSPCLEILTSLHYPSSSGLQVYLPVSHYFYPWAWRQMELWLNANCTPLEILVSLLRLYVTMIYSCLIFGCCYTRLSAKELMLLNCGVGEDSWESLGLQGDQSWVFLGRTDAEAETPVLWPPHAKSWLIGKDPECWEGLGAGGEGMTEDEMAGWHHRLDGHESEWTLGVGDGQGGLACCDSWGRKELDMTEWLNWRK